MCAPLFWVGGAAIAVAAVLFVGFAAPANAATEKVVYAFKGGSDGLQPQASLIDVKGILYGTTVLGGTGTCPGGCGTVFSVSESGNEKVLHSFQGGSDGAMFISMAGLIAVKDTLTGTYTLYGTTDSGGGTGCIVGYSSCGTVFSITPSGTYKVIYSFKGGSDGLTPYGGLIAVNDRLYGTTVFGGGTGCGGGGSGTVFSVTPGGTEKVLYSFKGGSDGALPYEGLTAVKNTLTGTYTLYGTTTGGGGTGCGGYGTVFSVTPSGTEKVLYVFKGGSDGSLPLTGVIALKNTLTGTYTLYGTTDYGGGTGCAPFPGCGTVFSIAPSGKEKVLYRFTGGSDGGNPQAGLIAVKNTLTGTYTLYGTTLFGGGGAKVCGQPGCGTVFSVTPSGTEKVLYAFKGGSDGENPDAGLIAVKNTLTGTYRLYGTTAGGGGTGCGGYGCGTVFSVTP
jgi:uncharacterized repeat protein (TIGR03803 family)